MIDYSVDPNSDGHCTFRFDETVAVNGPIPAGVWFGREGLVQIALVSRERDSRDYAGWYGDNDTPFRVQIREDAAPHWYDSQLDDAIDAL